MSAPAHALAGVRRVRVGTTNGPKIAAATEAIRAYAPGAGVEGAAVDSGVSEQPVGFEEIARGARTRAERAFAFGDCELAVGYEDGLVDLPGLHPEGAECLNVGCAAVTDGARTSLGLSSGFAYPPECAERAIAQREPIGDLFDDLWERYADERDARASAHGAGNVGKLTLGVLPRSEYARHAIVCALVRFLHPELYARRAGEESAA